MFPVEPIKYPFSFISPPETTVWFNHFHVLSIQWSFVLGINLGYIVSSGNGKNTSKKQCPIDPG